MYRGLLHLVSIIFLVNFSWVTSETCHKIRSLLNDETITIAGPSNDICILNEASCCDKSVEKKLLDKARQVLKNRMFMVLNQFLNNIDNDKHDKNVLLTNIIKDANLAQDRKIDFHYKFSAYTTGDNTLTTLDLDAIKNAAALGSITKALGTSVPEICQNLLYFELSSLKNAEHQYLSSILVMLRGYEIMSQIITQSKAVDLTDACYIGAVRGGLKFGGCNKCYDSTEFSHPCVKLCRNIVSGCLKGHIKAREYLQHMATYQLQMNELVRKFSSEREAAISSLKADIKSKLQVDQEFYTSCSGLQKGSSEQTISAVYEYSSLSYSVEDARNTLDASWLCTYVFSGVSEVNCWNRSSVGKYRLNVYEFTSTGQRQNPEVPGKGPVVNIVDQIKQFTDYKYNVEELSQGRDVLKPSSAAPLSFTLLTISVALYLTLT